MHRAPSYLVISWVDYDMVAQRPESMLAFGHHLSRILLFRFLARLRNSAGILATWEESRRRAVILIIRAPVPLAASTGT